VGVPSGGCCSPLPLEWPPTWWIAGLELLLVLLLLKLLYGGPSPAVNEFRCCEGDDGESCEADDHCLLSIAEDRRCGVNAEALLAMVVGASGTAEVSGGVSAKGSELPSFGEKP
jgi:hypothetical protein